MIIRKLLGLECNFKKAGSQNSRRRAHIFLLLTFMVLANYAFAEKTASKAPLRSIYVPAYSSVYILQSRRYPLAVTLSVRNIDPKQSMAVESIQYFSSKGELLDTFPIKETLQPFASTEIHITEADSRGGIGAGFVIRWRPTQAPLTNLPLAEAVMAGTQAQQGISFSSRGVHLRPKAPTP